MIVITETFEKSVTKIKSVTMDDVRIEIQKHSSGLDNFKSI